MGAPDVIDGVAFGDGLTDAFLVSLLSGAEIAALQCPGAACSPTYAIAQLSFTALADGTPSIGLVNWGLANDVKCAYNRQCYPAVPQPGSLALLGLGLLGLGLGRRPGVVPGSGTASAISCPPASQSTLGCTLPFAGSYCVWRTDQTRPRCRGSLHICSQRCSEKWEPIDFKRFRKIGMFYAGNPIDLLFCRRLGSGGSPTEGIFFAGGESQ